MKAAVISSSNGNDLLKVRLELSTPLSVEGEDASLLELKFSLGSSATVAVSTVLHQLLGQRLQIEQRLRSSRSGSIRLPGGSAAQLVASAANQPYQQSPGDARAPARRKSSTSGALMCRKAIVLEPLEVNQSSIDAEGQRADMPPAGDRARAERAKAMEERRRELEQSISLAETKSKQRSVDQAAGKQKDDAKSRGGQDAAKKRSSRIIGEVPVSSVSEANRVNVASKAAKEVEVETIPASCIVESQGKILTQNLFDQK